MRPDPAESSSVSWGSQPLAEDIAQRRDILGQAILSQNPLPAGRADPAAQAAVVLQLSDSVRQLLGAGRRNQKAADSVLNQLRNPMDEGGHARYLHGHRFHQ